MAFAEKRGKLWRARWDSPDGSTPSKSGFTTRKAAEDYARDQEAAIRAGTYIDPRGGQISVSDWVNIWYPAQDLELNTLSIYRYLIEVHILPRFANCALVSLTREEIALWEKQTERQGYTTKTNREARSLLATILGDAVPSRLQHNPAFRQRGKGRRGQQRIEQAEKAEKIWATPLDVLLFAERCSALSGSDTDFVMAVTMAYTGMRWSEALGMQPGCIKRDTLKVDWKLYELDARFYRGRPKDGSIRPVDLPPFLAEMLDRYQVQSGPLTCTCKNLELPWCPGRQYVFLGPEGGHFRRSNYSSRTVRPAADGWYAGRSGSHPRGAAPVLVDFTAPWPGAVKSPWPPAVQGQPFEPPIGRGVPRLTATEGRGRCSACGHSVPLRKDGLIASHWVNREQCVGTGATGAEPMALASWLPVRTGLTPHGLRHGHQTWLDDLKIRYVLQSERMGHEVEGMRGVYAHITPRMRAELRTGLQQLWDESLRQRYELSPVSAVTTLDRLFEPQREAGAYKVGTQPTPRIERRSLRPRYLDREAGH